MGKRRVGRLGETKEQVLERERRCWEMRQQGRTFESIAAELKIDRSTASKACKRVGDRVLAEMKESVEHLKAEQDAQLDHLYSEAVAEWGRSKEAARTVTRRRLGADGGEQGEQVTQQAVERTGDPVYLAEARAILADKRKLWGLDAPQKVAQTDPTGTREAGLAGPGLVDSMAQDLRVLLQWSPPATPTAPPPASDPQPEEPPCPGPTEPQPEPPAEAAQPPATPPQP